MTAVFFMLALQAMPVGAGEPAIRLPDGQATFADGRKPIQALYQAYLKLLDPGWTLEILANSEPPGTTAALPIIALVRPIRVPRSGSWRESTGKNRPGRMRLPRLSKTLKDSASSGQWSSFRSSIHRAMRATGAT